MTLGERLTSIRKKKGISQKMLAIQLGVTQSAISHWEADKKIPSSKALLEIADRLGVTLDYLTGRETEDDAVRIPVIGAIRAGIPLNAIEEYDDWEEIPKHMAASGRFVGLRVKGNSMSPKILDGDIAIIRLQDDAESGDICAVLVNGDDATLKKIQRLPNGINLIPFNTAEFDQIFYSSAQVRDLPVRIFGKLVEIRRKF